MKLSELLAKGVLIGFIVIIVATARAFALDRIGGSSYDGLIAGAIAAVVVLASLYFVKKT
jgi:hypothetical protein